MKSIDKVYKYGKISDYEIWPVLLGGGRRPKNVPQTPRAATPVPKGRDNCPRRVATPVTIIVTVCTRFNSNER